MPIFFASILSLLPFYLTVLFPSSPIFCSSLLIFFFLFSPLFLNFFKNLFYFLWQEASQAVRVRQLESKVKHFCHSKYATVHQFNATFKKLTWLFYNILRILEMSASHTQWGHNWIGPFCTNDLCDVSFGLYKSSHKMNGVYFQNNYVTHYWHRNCRWPMLNFFVLYFSFSFFLLCMRFMSKIFFSCVRVIFRQNF